VRPPAQSHRHPEGKEEEEGREGGDQFVEWRGMRRKGGRGNKKRGKAVIDVSLTYLLVPEREVAVGHGRRKGCKAGREEGRRREGGRVMISRSKANETAEYFPTTETLKSLWREFLRSEGPNQTPCRVQHHQSLFHSTLPHTSLATPHVPGRPTSVCSGRVANPTLLLADKALTAMVGRSSDTRMPVNECVGVGVRGWGGGIEG